MGTSNKFYRFCRKKYVKSYLKSNGLDHDGSGSATEPDDSATIPDDSATIPDDSATIPDNGSGSAQI